jgi:hypothetical protein
MSILLLICPLPAEILCCVPGKPYSIQTMLSNLFNSPKFADIEFVVGPADAPASELRRFYAHKQVLGIRSPVFEAQIFHNFAESRENEIRVTDLSPEAFECVLRCIYTDQANLSAVHEDRIIEVTLCFFLVYTVCSLEYARCDDRNNRRLDHFDGGLSFSFTYIR